MEYSIMRKILNLKKFGILFFLLLSCFVVYQGINWDDSMTLETMKSFREHSRSEITIVIDPGHGGRDPGKVGVHGELEKDINLNIALKLKEFLSLNDIHVVMIREEDVGLYSESDSNKKVVDMRNRVDIINSSGAVLAVSIHQNSFTEESVNGAQVFYYSKSEEGKNYAEIMQNQLIRSLQNSNTKQARGNDSYYMLTKTTCPIVIVESGYLSNGKEAALLATEAYQEKLAWSIHLGILTYLNQMLEENNSQSNLF